MRVVIVDDHSGIRRLLTDLLNLQPGIEVVGSAADGDEALPVVADREPDVVVMDYSMARMNGLDATRALKAAMPWVDVVAFTSTQDPAVVGDFLAADVSRHFDKAQIDALVEYLAARAVSG